MRILLTGANGQLGTAIKSLCASERVIACDATDLAQLDITNLQRVRRFVESCKPDFIVNCAAYNDVDAAEDSNRFDDVCLVNSIGPRNLAIASDEFKIPLMHFSTDYVFDGAKNTPYQITDLPHPINIYGGSKLLGESFVRSLTKMHFVVRLSWLFGPSGFNFVTKVSDWAKTSTEIRIADDQISCPCYTEDIAPAAIDLLESKAYGLYHMTNSGWCSRFEWAKYILDCLELGTNVVAARSSDFSNVAPRPGYSVLGQFPTFQTIGYELPDWRNATKRFLLSKDW